MNLPQLRFKNPSRWPFAVLVGVHILILVHIVHWLSSGRTIAGLEPSEAMEFSKHGIVNLGLIFLVGAAALTAVFGRFFCGWGCHIIAMQDLCRWLLIKAGITPKPLRSRLLRWIPIPIGLRSMVLRTVLVSWSTEYFADNQNANALRWGTMYNFWFDADAAPQTGSALISLFRTGLPSVLEEMVLAPSTGESQIFTDGFESGDTSAW